MPIAARFLDDMFFVTPFQDRVWVTRSFSATQ